MGGACGYGNMYQTGYGLMTAAASYALFSDGYQCGACYEVKCLGSPAVPDKQVCSGKTVTVTITNSCPPGGNGVCNPPKHHLDMSEAAWGVLSSVRGAGILQTQMRRVPCKKSGGVAFMLTGNPYYLQVLIFNVAGPGNINKLEVSDGTTWDVMDHNWGASYSKSKKYGGKELSFRLTAVSGDVLTVNRAVPSNWYIGAAYMSRVNFGGGSSSSSSSGSGGGGGSSGSSSPKKKHPGKPKKKKSPPPSSGDSNSKSPAKKKKKKGKKKKSNSSNNNSNNSNKSNNNNNNSNNNKSSRKTLETWGPLEEIQLSDWERDALLGKVMDVNVTMGAFGQH
ncbi:hypothetical protein CLOP_g20038 [Closterium sp. NIES-67]|nr:hypothetical protein CLOP_g20038 [Closterium sp. NIES-67]